MAPAKPIVGKKRKYFTVEEANKASAAGQDDRRRYCPPVPRGGGLATAALDGSRDRRRPPKDLYAEELAQSQGELDAEEAKLTTYIEELKRLGVEFKGPDGLCDFYSIMDGREVFLCWRLGEPEVSHWHDLDAGFAGRQPLTESRKCFARRRSVLIRHAGRWELRTAPTLSRLP